MPDNTMDCYHRAYVLLMAACNNALDLLPRNHDVTTLLQNAVEQAEEIFLSAPDYTA